MGHLITALPDSSSEIKDNDLLVYEETASSNTTRKSLAGKVKKFCDGTLQAIDITGNGVENSQDKYFAVEFSGWDCLREPLRLYVSRYISDSAPWTSPDGNSSHKGSLTMWLDILPQGVVSNLEVNYNGEFNRTLGAIAPFPSYANKIVLYLRGGTIATPARYYWKCSYPITVGVNYLTTPLDSGTIAAEWALTKSIGSVPYMNKTVKQGYIGPTQYGTDFKVYGDIRAVVDVYNQNGVISNSDRNLKEEIRDSDLGLDFVKDLRPVSYKWKDQYDSAGNKITDYKRRHYGLIAQELNDLLNVKGISSNDCAAIINDNGLMGIRYTELIPILIKAVQELTARVEELEKERN